MEEGDAAAFLLKTMVVALRPKRHLDQSAYVKLVELEMPIPNPRSHSSSSGARSSKHHELGDSIARNKK